MSNSYKSSSTKQFQLPEFIVNGNYFSTVVGGDLAHMDVVLQASLSNYSDDTLKYWGTDCEFKELFDVTDNKYLKLANLDCDEEQFKLISIPPHRSQRIKLTLLQQQPPEGLLILKVTMKFYRYLSGDVDKDIKTHEAAVLSDSTTLRFNIEHMIYETKTDRTESERKDKLILPASNFYLLTDDDRKGLAVTIDPQKVSKATNVSTPFIYSSRYKRRFMNVPVVIHNYNNDTLKYGSMSCSWMDFYHIDNQTVKTAPYACNKNIPVEISIPPHDSIRKILKVVYNPKQIVGHQKLRIGVNINKSVGDFFNFDLEDDLWRYNLVWSNEIALPEK